MEAWNIRMPWHRILSIDIGASKVFMAMEPSHFPNLHRGRKTPMYHLIAFQKPDRIIIHQFISPLFISPKCLFLSFFLRERSEWLKQWAPALTPVTASRLSPLLNFTVFDMSDVSFTSCRNEGEKSSCQIRRIKLTSPLLFKVPCLFVMSFYNFNPLSPS